MQKLIGVDVGGTQLRAGLFDLDLNLLERVEQRTQSEDGADAVFDRLVETIRQVLPESPEELDGIGVALPGPVDFKSGTLIAPPNLPFKNAPLRDMLAKALGRKVFVGNDADLAGLAEHQRGAGQGTQTMIYITVSTGVGGGIIIGGKPFSGRGQGAEIGHMVVMPDGPLCGCGHRGHLEAVSSGTSIASITRSRIQHGEPSLVTDLVGGDVDKISAEVVGQAALKGDALALSVVRQAGTYLGIAVASLMVILHPDMFVFGGGDTKLGSLLFEPMTTAIRDYAMHPLYWDKTPIVTAQLKEEVGLIGAAALVKVMGSS